MKKFFMMMVAVMFSLIIGFSSCDSCNKAPVEPVAVDTTVVATDTTEAVAVLVVENLISTDRQEMYLKTKGNYRWFETGIVLPEFLDSEDVTSDPEMVVNVFQSVIESENGADTWVFKFQHFADGTVVKDSVHGFWIEDMPLNEEVIKLKYTEAYDRMMQANYPKPHSKQVVLRNPIGPVAINSQWIFGNIQTQLWVDAVTGDVKNSNPAFPEEKGFKMPLGEWP